jgi:hypothetical protein
MVQCSARLSGAALLPESATLRVLLLSAVALLQLLFWFGLVDLWPLQMSREGRYTAGRGTEPPTISSSSGSQKLPAENPSAYSNEPARRLILASRSQMAFDSVALRLTAPWLKGRQGSEAGTPAGHVHDSPVLDAEAGLVKGGLEFGRGHLRFSGKRHGVPSTRQPRQQLGNGAGLPLTGPARGADAAFVKPGCDGPEAASAASGARVPKSARLRRGIFFSFREGAGEGPSQAPGKSMTNIQSRL